MNTVLIAIVGLAWFYFAYRWYSRRIDRVLVKPDDRQSTPGEQFNDNCDYVPTSPFVLFGHHFSSICAAGPIVGPALAVAYWGWGVSVVWILLGGVLMGAVADFTSLVVAVRHGGQSIARVAGEVITPRSRVAFTVFI